MPQSHINRSVDIFIFIQRHTDHQHCTASELKNTYPNKNISIRISMQPEDMAVVVEKLW